MVFGSIAQGFVSAHVDAANAIAGGGGGGGGGGSTTARAISPPSPPKVYNFDSSWVAGANPSGPIPNPSIYRCNAGTVLTGMNVTMDAPRDLNGKILKINSVKCTPIDSANRNSHDNSATVPVVGAGRLSGLRTNAFNTRTLTCPQSSAMVGLHGEGTSNSITYIKPLCKKADESIAGPRSCNIMDGPQCLAARSREKAYDSFGRPEPTRTRYVVNCEDNHRVTGIAVESGSWVDRVSPLCTPKQVIESIPDPTPATQTPPAPPPLPILTPRNPNLPPDESKSLSELQDESVSLSKLQIGAIAGATVVLVIIVALIIYYSTKKK
jgi:hypothetical protein